MKHPDGRNVKYYVENWIFQNKIFGCFTNNRYRAQQSPYNNLRHNDDVTSVEPMAKQLMKSVSTQYDVCTYKSRMLSILQSVH